MARKRRSSKKRGVSKKTATRRNGTLKKGFRYARGGRIVKARGR